MLYLSQNSANELEVVCDDLLTIVNPYYLWRLEDQETKIEYLIFLTNSKQNNSRYDEFTLTLPTDLDLPTGTYEWWIYETDDNSTTAYTGLNVLSTGGAKVITEFEEDTDYEPTDTDKVYKAQ